MAPFNSMAGSAPTLGSVGALLRSEGFRRATVEGAGNGLVVVRRGGFYMEHPGRRGRGVDTDRILVSHFLVGDHTSPENAAKRVDRVAAMADALGREYAVETSSDGTMLSVSAPLEAVASGPKYAVLAPYGDGTGVVRSLHASPQEAADEAVRQIVRAVPADTREGYVVDMQSTSLGKRNHRRR